ncbi:MAG: phosphate ABC transporter permease subunit PstC [Bdellovibrionales bacterium]|nr:phosphate ABC transporter permease subunit PstC [Bdellovibrionales bacterium]
MALAATVFTLLLFSSFVVGRSRARAAVSGSEQLKLHSLPNYHGCYVALWAGVPALLILLAWTALEPLMLRTIVLDAIPERTASMSQQELSVLFSQIQNRAEGAFGVTDADETLGRAIETYQSLKRTSHSAMIAVFLSVCVLCLLFARSKISVNFRARHAVERAFNAFLLLSSLIAILTTIGIVCSLIFESIRFFQHVSFTEFVFGAKWSPQTAMRSDQVASEGAFGAVPLFLGTILIAFIAMCVATPVGLFAAIYLAEYAGKKTRAVAKPILEILAGIPTVVYGFFAALTVAPYVKGLAEALGLAASSESALAAGLVMGVMIIPFISSLSDDVINAVPQTLRDGSYAMGATKSETIRQVIMPAALPGIVGAILLAISRAVGETMIVVMAAGLAANLTLNPLSNVTTVTVQIVTILIGDQEFDSAKTLSAFALGLMLFFVTLALNVIALRIVKKYREKYD